MLNASQSQLFDENVGMVNSMILRVMEFAVLVPLSFIIFTIAGLWDVPHSYSTILIVYTIIVSTVLYFLNKAPHLQGLTVYAGLIGSMFFVCLLGVKSVIVITISYAFVPVLSCFYYNVKLTRIMNLANFLAVLCVTWIRSQTILDIYVWVDNVYKTPLNWFISNGIGITVESIFVYMITVSLARRTEKTLTNLWTSSEERNTAFDELRKRNKYIVKINSEIEKTNQSLKMTQYKIIQFVSQVLGSHDLFTGRHLLHTKKYVEIIAKELRDSGYYRDQLTDENIELYSTAALLHDIGKVHIPEGVLNKIGKFTPEEYELMKIHPSEGKKLLEFLPVIDDGIFNEIAMDMAFYHHEKWDGSGYPNKLKGTEIPLCARIMAAADVLDALISQRLYKEPMPVDEAMEVFEKSKGLHFEPCIADAVINLKNLISIIDEDFKMQESSTNAEELEWWMRYHSNAVKFEVKTDFIGASTEPQSAVYNK